MQRFLNFTWPCIPSLLYHCVHNSNNRLVLCSVTDLVSWCLPSPDFCCRSDHPIRGLCKPVLCDLYFNIGFHIFYLPFVECNESNPVLGLYLPSSHMVKRMFNLYMFISLPSSICLKKLISGTLIPLWSLSQHKRYILCYSVIFLRTNLYCGGYVGIISRSTSNDVLLQ